jgi:hypothetical protein
MSGPLRATTNSEQHRNVMITSPSMLFPEVQKKAHAAEKQRYQRRLASKLNVQADAVTVLWMRRL